MGEIDSGGSPMQHVQWLNARIWRLRKEGDFVEAIRLAREVCDFICDTGGAESVVYAQALGSRGRLCRTLLSTRLKPTSSTRSSFSVG